MTYALKMMVKALFEVRGCPMLLVVFVCFVSLSYFTDAADDQTFNDGSLSSAVTFIPAFIPIRNLTVNQTQSTVTIEFNSRAIDVKNKTELNAIYRNVHRAIIENLNQRNSTTAASTLIPTSLTSTIITTTPTPTTITTTTITSTTTERRQREPEPGKRKKRRRRRQKTDDDVIYAEVDLLFVEVDYARNKNEILIMSLLLYKEGFHDLDYGTILIEAVNDVHKDGTLEKVSGAPVVQIYRGLPEKRQTTEESSQNYQFLIWPLVTLFVILLFIGIGVLIYWKKTSKKRRITTATGSS